MKIFLFTLLTTLLLSTSSFAATASASFTSTGGGAVLRVNDQDKFTYDVSGTFVGRVELQVSTDGGQTFKFVQQFSAAASGEISVNTPNGKSALYRFNCRSYTSGTIVTSIVDADTLIQSFNDKNGVSMAQFTESGLSLLNQKELRLYEGVAGGTNYHSFKAPATLAANFNFTLPADDGTASQVLTTDGSGVLSWTTVSSGSGDFKADGTVAMTADLNMGTHKIINLVDPTTAQQAATMNYVDTTSATKTLSNVTGFAVSLLPDVSGSRNIGSSGKRINQVFTTSIQFASGQIGEGDTTPSGNTTSMVYFPFSPEGSAIITQNRTSSSNSSSILLETGNVVDGISGDISLRAGVPSGSGTSGKTIVTGRGLQLVATGTKAACAVGVRGTIFYTPGGAGVADLLEVCRKDASDVYAWTALY